MRDKGSWPPGTRGVVAWLFAAFSSFAFSPFCSPALAAPAAEEFVEQPWREEKVELPPFPENASLLDFYVSPTTTNRFFIDLEHLSAGKDGVLRYTLVVLSASGVRNVTFEGMRCATRERRIYASGRNDKRWVSSRNESWFPILEGGANRHHAALFTEFFCPGGVIETRPEEIRKAFKREGNPYPENGS
ncbi:MAG: CNP1-like family protein [Zoogloeaceae bacterium]|nr:CNP1-like family protein [Zoogloeaceae bacterium]